MVTPRPLEGWSSEKRTYRQFSPEQKAEVVLAGLRGDRERAGRLWRAPERRDAVRPVARSAAGRRQAALANPRGKTPEQAELDRLTARWASSSGPWAGGPTSRRSRGNPLRAGVSVHVAQSRVVVAAGSQPALVARVAGGLPASPVPAPEPPAWGGWTGAHRPGRPGHRQRGQGQVRPTAPAWWRRWLVASSAGPVNCKRVQRAMRTHRLLQPSRSTSPGPGFRVTRPDELWHLDVTKPWTAPARLGSTCRRSSTAPPGRSPADRLRCTATGDEAIACAEAAVLGAPSLLEG
jgi:hypothetical protein